MANSITSIKEINRLNFLDIFEKINGVEEILKNDPAGVYSKMDYKTKEYYRNTIKEISKRTKISEIYISKKLVELAELEKDKSSRKAHIGYYLISDGKEKLYNYLGISKNIIRKDVKVKLYIFGIYFISLIFSLLTGINISKKTNILVGMFTFILVLVPISEIIIQSIQYILGKIVKPKLLPKLDMSEGIDEKIKPWL